MKFLRIRNFERFQHYRDRRPPWIKLYRDLWNDPRFFELSEADRYFLISFFVIASQNDNKVPPNQSWLKREMATRKGVPIDRLLASGWLEWWEQDASKQDASTVLAKSVHDDSIVLSLARSRETERETEGDPPVVPQRVTDTVKYPPDFEEFWLVYPRHVGKGEALKSWRKIRPSSTLKDTILAAVIQQKESADWTREQGRYIPHPATWLNQSRWDDDVRLIAKAAARTVEF